MGQIKVGILIIVIGQVLQGYANMKSAETALYSARQQIRVQEQVAAILQKLVDIAASRPPAQPGDKP